ncbi:uncharacterized protein LOC134554349 [Prinia subflava]|uniref:uncharacterized protein LOC134554349 n=1 Tax=Prinia subflava TaxID=208062 RepID=UPI002FE34AEA
MLTLPRAEGATGAAAGPGTNAAGAFQARQGQLISLPAPAAASFAAPDSGFRQLCSLSAGTSFVTLPHSTNTHLGLGMHLAYLILTVFLGQLLAAMVRGQVQQEPFVDTTEGTSIRINCSHPNIRMGDFIHFYRHLPGQRPELVAVTARASKDVRDPPGRLWVSADRGSSALWLWRPRRGDAAVYYCALGARAEEPGLRPGPGEGPSSAGAGLSPGAELAAAERTEEEWRCQRGGGRAAAESRG